MRKIFAFIYLTGINFRGDRIDNISRAHIFADLPNQDISRVFIFADCRRKFPFQQEDNC